MGFRIGWFWKFLGITWGPKGGFRGYLFGGSRKSGCLVMFIALLAILGCLAVGAILLVRRLA